MTKTNKLFSWLGFGKGKTDQATPQTPTESTAATHSQPDAVHNVVTDGVAAENSHNNSTVVTESAQVVTGSEPVQRPAAMPVDAPAESAPVPSQSAATTPLDTDVETGSTPVLSQATTTIAEHIPVATPTANAPEPDAESDATAVPVVSTQPLSVAQPVAEPEKKLGFFARLRQGLAKTSANLGNGLASLFLGKKIDDELYEELETQLLLADVGIETSQKLIRQLTEHANRKQLKDAEALYEKLQDEMADMLAVVEQPLDVSKADGPYVILMVGVNGVGKTTTIGKMAQQFKQQGKTVMLAAGDTFRAAAVEQLQVWGERNQIPVIAQHTGADSASVIFDAYQAAKARGVDVLIADTAGRLQNKTHLMDELKKIVRVMKKIDDAAPHEVMLTLDAGTGQNAISQAKIFHEAVQLTGISLTKLDGTAKGGVIFAIADQFKLPIRYIGVGEGLDDLRVFQSRDFIKALFNKES